MGYNIDTDPPLSPEDSVPAGAWCSSHCETGWTGSLQPPKPSSEVADEALPVAGHGDREASGEEQWVVGGRCLQIYCNALMNQYYYPPLINNNCELHYIHGKSCTEAILHMHCSPTAITLWHMKKKQCKTSPSLTFSIRVSMCFFYLFEKKLSVLTSNRFKKSLSVLKSSRQVGWNILCWSNSSYIMKSTKVIYCRESYK